jgi:hypothetical protein
VPGAAARAAALRAVATAVGWPLNRFGSRTSSNASLRQDEEPVLAHPPVRLQTPSYGLNGGETSEDFAEVLAG